MKLIPQKVIQMTLFLFVFSIIFSCSKDTDLLLDSVLNEPEVSLEEKEPFSEEIEEDGLISRTFAFSPTNDAYLQNEYGHDKSIIRLQEDYRTSYLMFDLSPINGTIKEAVLQFSIDSDEGDGSITIHKGINGDWTEENLNQNNAPALEAYLAIINKAYKVGAPEKVALDPNNLSSEVTTLVMTHSTGNDLAFASKEHPDNKGPKLIITYEAPAGSPLIEQLEEEESTPETNSTPETTPTPTPENDTSNDNTASTEGAYFVTVNGKSSNNGRSESNAWSIEHAFETAKAGDVVYIKAGSYGNKELIADNSGTTGNPIKFIGYTNTPGDLVSNGESTFKYGDVLDYSKMPFLKGTSTLGGVGLKVPENNIEIQNLQITNYQSGIITQGINIKLKNIIVSDIGIQENNSQQNGKGIHIYGNNTILEDCFVLNANSEGINIKGASDCTVKNSKVYSNNIKNPTGYYILISNNATKNIIENCVAYRDPKASLHQGHGILIKDRGSLNTIKGCKTYNTGYEVNFSGVKDNTFEDCAIYGRYSEYSDQYSTRISIINGAHHNIFKNFYIEDARYAIKFRDFDDGFSANDGDRDEEEGGHNNKFIRIVVNKAKNIAIGESVEVGAEAFSENNEFTDCLFENITGVPFYSYQTIKKTTFVNCSFKNIPSSKLLNLYDGGSFQMQFQNCSFTNVSFPIP